MTRPQWALALLLLAAVALGLYSALPRPVPGTDTPSGIGPEPSTASATTDDSDASTASVPATPDAGAMAAPDAPAQTAFEALLARADAGEPDAACEAAITLMQCQLLDQFGHVRIQALETAEREAEAAGNLKDANMAASELLATKSRLRSCREMPMLTTGQGRRYLRQAALAGVPEAVIRYANGESLGIHLNDYGSINTPAFDEWRQQAPVLVQQAFQAGNPATVLMQVSVRGTQPAQFAVLMPPDELRDYAMLRLAQSLFGNDPALARYRLPPGLDADQRDAAEAQAAKWHDEHFRGRRVRLADHTASLMPVNGLWSDEYAPWPSPPDSSVSACGSPRA